MNVFLTGVVILAVALAAATAASPMALDRLASVLRARAAAIRASRKAYCERYAREMEHAAD